MGGLPALQHSVVMGSLLGDGSMRRKRHALLEINHSVGQRAYVDWKYGILSDLVRTPPKERSSNAGRRAYRFVTLSRPELTPYYELFYERGKKCVPAISLEPLALAVWFMDDGCKSRTSLYLNTQQFDIASQLRLTAMLRTSYGIAATLNRDKSYFRIRIAVASVARFVAAVEPYILPEMQYKLPDGGATRRGTSTLL